VFASQATSSLGFRILALILRMLVKHLRMMEVLQGSVSVRMNVAHLSFKSTRNTKNTKKAPK
jgi:hypothetical protein